LQLKEEVSIKIGLIGVKNGLLGHFQPKALIINKLMLTLVFSTQGGTGNVAIGRRPL